MADYRQMYYIMMNATEQAINILIDAQRQCEELYINAEDPKITVFRDQKKISEKTISD
ncbi:MAG: hypothetical protein IJN42_02740 [Clostridia bacterium]|nr:hypothetical protein [Clostridia bacterium]